MTPGEGRPTLVIGNRNYSSWSLRPWLLLRHHGVAFAEEVLPLDTPEFATRIAAFSGAGRVPVLVDGPRHVWDSLAICEYVNERWLEGAGWPADLDRRALARSAAAEMHSGFAAMRAQLPMSVRRRPNAYRWRDDAQRDIDRVQALWRTLRAGAGDGPFLLGGFGIVDAMFAPVCVRFRAYGVEVDAVAAAYMATIFALPAFGEWEAAALAETVVLAADEL
ncbi:MAG: glutathione S-transferase family protein [Arenimonas sp.]